MSWFDEPGHYYTGDQPVDWSLGDIVVFPWATLWAGESAAALEESPPFGAIIRRTLWVPAGDRIAVTAEAGWAVGMVVLDDCALDRDFNRELNRREREYRAAGLSPDDARDRAEEEARAVEGLDSTLVVARVRPYGDFDASRHDALRRAEPFGFFPVVESDTVDEGVVDFAQVSTVDRQALIGRVASLSKTSRNALRWKLAEFTALRARSTEAAIEAAVGRSITKAEAYQRPSGKRQHLVVRLELDGGEEVLTLEAT